MKICTCDHCRYIFAAQLVPAICPDCGRKGVRRADGKEIREYNHFRKIIREEIRMGVIPG